MSKIIDYTNLNEKSGIYMLINSENNKRYVGSSKNLYDRLHQHFHNLKYNKHHSLHLQASYNKYGESNFEYEVLEFCDLENLYEREQYYLDILHPEYNKRTNAERNDGILLSNETKEKISKTLKDKYKSGEIVTYKQEHAWIKVYCYNCETLELEAEYANIADAYRKIFNKSEEVKCGLGSKDLFRVINNKFILSDYEITDIKNFCFEIYFKTRSRIGNYIVSEFNNELTYYKTVEECCEKCKVGKTTLNRRIKDLNSIYELKSGIKIYYLAQYKPI